MRAVLWLGQIGVHGLAGATTVAIFTLGGGLLYFGLLLWALVANKGLGGPFALPFMVVVAFVLGVLAVVVVLLPVSVAAQAICGDRTRLLQIPTAALLCVLETCALGASGALYWEHRLTVGALLGLTAGIILLIPLGIYWWLTQAGLGALSLCTRVARRLLLRAAPANPPMQPTGSAGG